MAKKLTENSLKDLDHKDAPEPDVVIADHGSVALVSGLTETARVWLDENIDPCAQTWGRGVVVEPRYLDAIVEGMTRDDLIVGITA